MGKVYELLGQPSYNQISIAKFGSNCYVLHNIDIYNDKRQINLQSWMSTARIKELKKTDAHFLLSSKSVAFGFSMPHKHVVFLW